MNSEKGNCVFARVAQCAYPLGFWNTQKPGWDWVSPIQGRGGDWGGWGGGVVGVTLAWQNF